jgi:hypothetical protein
MRDDSRTDPQSIVSHVARTDFAKLLLCTTPGKKMGKAAATASAASAKGCFVLRRSKRLADHRADVLIMSIFSHVVASTLVV